YLDHLPLARQVRQMARAGLSVDTQTLWDQLLALSHHLTPTYEALGADVLTAPVLGADETTWQLMEPGRSKTWWVWALCRPAAVVYRLLGTRSAAGAATALGARAGRRSAPRSARGSRSSGRCRVRRSGRRARTRPSSGLDS